MDDVHVSHSDHGTEVRMQRRLQGPGSEDAQVDRPAEVLA
jgi:hypothetical protein